MPKLDSRDFLPDAAAIADLLETSADDLVPRSIRRALVEPAVHLTQRPNKRLRAQLVALGAKLTQKAAVDDETLAACSAAVELLHAGSLIVDDVQDGSAVRRGAPAVHLEHGIPRALCTGNWLYFWPLRLIRATGLPPARELAASRMYQTAVERAHYGQALDLSVRADELTQSEVVKLATAALELKTGAITSLAMSLGALVGGARQSEVAHVAAFGLRFGVTLQTLDDFGNLIGRVDPEKRREDLRQRKLSGVWLQVARRASAAEYEEFQAAVRRLHAGDDRAVDEYVARHDSLDIAVAEARAELEAAFDELAASLGLPDNTPLIRELQCVAEGLIHAYF